MCMMIGFAGSGAGFVATDTRTTRYWIRDGVADPEHVDQPNKLRRLGGGFMAFSGDALVGQGGMNAAAHADLEDVAEQATKLSAVLANSFDAIAPDVQRSLSKA